MVGERIMPARMAVFAAKEIPPIVAHAALLGAPADRLDFAGVRLAAKIPAAKLQRLAPLEARYRPAQNAARSVDPAVQTVFQTVDARVVIIGTKSGKQLPHDIGLAVAVCVL